MKILVVDDSRQTTLMLVQLLSLAGHEVVTAADGEAAWALLEQEAIPLVITDWVMPRLDGLELCRRIRADARLSHTYVILLTSRDDRADLIEGMEAGADDFVTKPFDEGELQVRVRAGVRIVELHGQLRVHNQDLRSANSRMKRDLEAAALVQRSLLPQSATSVGGLSMAWLFCPSAFVAGDCFNFFQLDEGTLGFYHLDVAGHGVPAALLSVTLNNVLLPLPQEGNVLKRFCAEPPGYELVRPAEAVAELNRRFQSDADPLLYFTMVYGTLDLASGRMAMTQAGHPHPLLLSRDGRSELLGGGGLPVGMLAEGDYETFEAQLDPGDRLYLYSDGITECESPDAEVYGAERLLQCLEASRDQGLKVGLDKLEGELRDWRGPGDFEDDVSLLALERL